MSDPKLNSALNIMRRMPPASVENSLAGLLELTPQLTDELLNHVDQPLSTQKDPTANKDYILCEYNRDGDSYRSPWSNEFFPPIDDGFKPSSKLRKMEIEANQLFDIYRKQYFETGYSSAYFFETDEEKEENFGACFLIHKDVDEVAVLKKGSWDSIHVFEANKVGDGEYSYKLTTTVMVAMVIKDEKKMGTADLSGNMTQQSSKKIKLSPVKTHIANMGQMLEEMELRIRNNIEGIYIQKTREVINGMRSATGERDNQWGDIAKALGAAMPKKA